MTTLLTEAVAVFKTSSGKESLRVIPPHTDLERWLFNAWGNHYGSEVCVTANGMTYISVTRRVFRKSYAAQEARRGNCQS